MTNHTPSYHRYRFPPEIIGHAVWLYHSFNVSFREVEDLLAQRDITVGDEPPPVAIMERRRTPDRRTRWRRGRRDRDWLTRPPHAWSRATLSSRLQLVWRFRRWVD